MDEHFFKIHKWLYPVSWLYGAVVIIRNKLFDWGLFRSKSFDVPVICVGNLSVGGTGKTPLRHGGQLADLEAHRWGGPRHRLHQRQPHNAVRYPQSVLG